MALSRGKRLNLGFNLSDLPLFRAALYIAAYKLRCTIIVCS